LTKTLLQQKQFNIKQGKRDLVLMKRKASALTLILALLVSAIAGTLLINLIESNSAIASLKVSAQPIETEVIHKEITIMPDGSFTVDYLCDNGTYVYDTNPEVPIIRNIFGNYYTFTGDVYGHLVIERDNIVVDGAGHKLQLEGYGSFAVSAGIRDRAHSNTEFVGTNNVVITNMVIEDFGYGIELAGSNNEVSEVTLTGGDRGGKAIWLSGSNNIIRDCRIFGNEGSGIYVSGTGAVISNNYIANNSEVGIEFPSAAGSLRKNTLVNNGQAFDFDTLPSTSNVIDSSNTVDGKPVYCWVNEHSKNVPLEAGYVLLSNCTNITVQGISIFNSSDSTARNSNGIYLYSTKDTLIKNNYLQAGAGITIGSSCQNMTITENYVGSGGISLTSSSNVSVIKNYVQSIGISLGRITNCIISKNTLRGCVEGLGLRAAHQNRILQNNIAECDIGINIFKSDENAFNGNNFVSNGQDVWEQHYTWEWPSYRYHESVNNDWDRNYWSNYTGIDKDGDGIGDTPHVIYEDKKDNYPLMSSVDIPEIIPEPMNSSASPSPTTAGTSTPVPSWKNFAAVVIVAIVILVVMGTGLLVYFKKRKHQTGSH
jgi:parallel beta-helix repeat protein